MVELEEPDKGRAWLIAVASCIINMLLSGISRMVGLLYVAVINEYGVTRAEATLPFTVRSAVRSLSGPLVGIIGQRFGIRNVTFWGGVVACLGTILCCFAPNVAWLVVLWGGVHGFGFALANTLFQVVVNQYFDKYRATASGIALSGACIGSLVFPVLIEWILDTYGLSGAFLFLGGIMMHVIPCALLLSVPQWVKYPEKYARLWALKHSSASVEGVNTIVAGDLSEDDNKYSRELTRTYSHSNCPVESTGVWKTSNDNLHKQRGCCVFDKEVIQKQACAEGNVQCMKYTTTGSHLVERTEVIQNRNTKTDCKNIFTISGQLQDSIANQREIETPPRPIKTCRSKSIIESLKIMFKLCANPFYVFICICMGTYIINFIPILTVVVDYSIDKGIHESDGKYLMNVMAIGDLVGRMGFGWVTDGKLMSIPCFMCLGFLLQGVFVILFPVATSLPAFMTFLVLYSMMAGTILAHFPILVLRYIDPKEQSVGIACYGTFSGMVLFAVPPMTGYYRDTVGSYDGMFYVTGIISIISGIIWLLEPVAVKTFYGGKGFKTGKLFFS